jgi:8-oxo-dGTP pyrophosphatase MutT (NUDIX family)
MIDADQLDTEAFAAALRSALARGLPGSKAQRTMSPHLAYGRHRGPVPDDARRAAVLLALHRTPEGWSIPAMLRPDTMRSHAGQVSLPGGLVELDETPVQAALREVEEELGVPAAGFTVVGTLSPVYVFISGFEITPLIAVAAQSLAFLPNPAEVAALVELPLARLCDPTSRGSHVIRRRGLQFLAPHFEIAERRIWGATSLILAEFVALLERL